ncbi:MAG: thiosulfate oxidation carrier complex protein SoxZ [Rhodocyclales bacterium]|nr:thiosulfate oxidation carrier complex protein SoxZ [Rhodocyclales bacterium]
MGAPIKIRAQLQGDIADIRVLMQHPMETGQRKDESGALVPLNFIQTFSVSLNGKPMIEGQLNTSVSKNPLFAFKARGIKAGDKLAVSWVDNLGDNRKDEIVVA